MSASASVFQSFSFFSAQIYNLLEPTTNHFRSRTDQLRTTKTESNLFCSKKEFEFYFCTVQSSHFPLNISK